MPIKKAAKKALRQSEKHRYANRVLKEAMKKNIKELMKLAKENKLTEAQALLSATCQVIDKAAQGKVIHKNNAARKKSLLSRVVSPKK